MPVVGSFIDQCRDLVLDTGRGRVHSGLCPAYDSYPGSCTDEIGQQDLLAIVLLNVSDKPVPTYDALDSLIEPLNALLSSPDVKRNLEDAGPATLDAVAKLFGVLDTGRPKGVRMRTHPR